MRNEYEIVAFKYDWALLDTRVQEQEHRCNHEILRTPILCMVLFCVFLQNKR